MTSAQTLSRVTHRGVAIFIIFSPSKISILQLQGASRTKRAPTHNCMCQYLFTQRTPSEPFLKPESSLVGKSIWKRFTPSSTLFVPCFGVYNFLYIVNTCIGESTGAGLVQSPGCSIWRQKVSQPERASSSPPPLPLSSTAKVWGHRVRFQAPKFY